MKHTPTPEFLVHIISAIENYRYHPKFKNISSEELNIQEEGLKRQFIKWNTACNAHEELVKALEVAHVRLQQDLKFLPENKQGIREESEKIIIQVINALAKAEGK